MAIEYLGLSEINGPLVVLEGVKNASYEEIVGERFIINFLLGNKYLKETARKS